MSTKLPNANVFDVIVVGGGGAGLAAAASAAEHGVRVLLLEKQRVLGGSTGIAVGSFTTSETDFQRKAGIQDRLEDHIEDAGKFAPGGIEAKNAAELRQFFLSQSRETLEWLVRLGLVFHGPSPEPPNRVPRMHNVVPGARAYILALQKLCRKHGGVILCGASVVRLKQARGSVHGVTVEIGGNTVEYRATKGVVLAAGDYANAPDLIARFKGEAFGAIEGIYEFAHGDGHRLAEEAGAALVNMDVTYGPELRFIPQEKPALVDYLPASRFFTRIMGWFLPLTPKPVMNAIIKRQLVTWQHPEDALFTEGAVLVNDQGERFCNEQDSPAREIAVANQPGKIAYILLDQRLVEHFSAWPHFVSTAPEIAYAYVKDYLKLRPDVAVAANSLDALAQARGLPSDALRQTVDAFNAYAGAGGHDAFGRTGDAAPLQGERWALLGPAKAYFTTTEGSPAVDQHCRVLDAQGAPIPGLYAVGQNGLGGQVLWGHGLHIAWAITSGRLVGKALAER